MKALAKTLLFFFFFMSFSVLAQDGGMTDPIQSSGTRGQIFSATIMAFMVLIASVAGMIFIFQGILKLFNYHKNPNDPKTSFKAIMFTFMAGALLTNSFGSASILVNTVTGSSGFCFGHAGNMTGDIQLSQIHNDACFDADSSDLTKQLRESLTTEGSDAWNEFKARITILFAVIQIIGFYYFIKSIFLLKGNSEGQNNKGIGSILIMMFFSSIAMDLSKGIELVVDTLNWLGLGGGN